MLIDHLRDSVAMLAAPAQRQVEWLACGQFHVDELALRLDDVLGASLGQYDFSKDLAHTLRSIHSALGSMSGKHQQALWTEDGLRSDSRWQVVRDLAQKALADPNWPGAVVPQ